MTTITLSPSEKETLELDRETLYAAVASVRREGYVILKDVVALEHISALQHKVLSDAAKIQERTDLPYNWIKGNLQQDPPPFSPYLFRDILVNDFAIQVTHTILGDGLVNALYSGNTSLPGGERQPVHADMGQLWPDLPHPTPPYALVVNVPLVDMDERNGSTEIWPTTHTDPTLVIGKDITVTEERLNDWRSRVQPIQPAVDAGSIIIRDIRLWHAGMPNHTSTPRPMIAMIHWVSWWPVTHQIPFSRDAEEIMKHDILKTSGEFTERPIDYLGHNAAYS
jgi:hypothetical protein